LHDRFTSIVSMNIFGTFSSAFLRRPALNLALAAVVLSPVTSFAQQYQVTGLVSNPSQPNVKFTDPNLGNTWGIARSSTTVWWLSNKAKGVATLVDQNGVAQPLVVTIPHSQQSAIGSPTGIVSNGSTDFEVEPGKPAKFIFASFDGTISGWNPQANPTNAITKVWATPGSVLTGATVAEVFGKRFLYVTDVNAGKIKVFDSYFRPVGSPGGAFQDELLPSNFVPFNVQNIGGNLYITFAQQNQAKNFVNSGSGLGAVDVFSPDGALLHRLETGALLNAPWGVVLAPSDFGSFSHSVLVGQFGSGEILAFDAVSGIFQGTLKDQNNKVIVLPGIWGIAFGAGNANSGGPNELYFNESIDKGQGGLFGEIVPIASDLTQGNDQ
jgi:uncharacterized protein (TIGR03118 family)